MKRIAISIFTTTLAAFTFSPAVSAAPDFDQLRRENLDKDAITLEQQTLDKSSKVDFDQLRQENLDKDAVADFGQRRGHQVGVKAVDFDQLRRENLDKDAVDFDQLRRENLEKDAVAAVE